VTHINRTAATHLLFHMLDVLVQHTRNSPMRVVGVGLRRHPLAFDRKHSMSKFCRIACCVLAYNMKRVIKLLGSETM